ncbi:hypothetical protein H7F33_13600 [Pedobacter sp. PAMC26386]|nr:hypothetical protein H7F33_13600 [Pedobacter sp. PAMC26386]
MRMTMLAMLLPFFCFGQIDQNNNSFSTGVIDSVPGTSIVLKNYEVIFQKVYTSKLTGDELAEKVFTLLSAEKTFRFNRRVESTGSEFIGKLICYNINTNKYGGTVFATPAVLSYPLEATVIVNIKDFKYRVTIVDIVFKDIPAATKGEFIDGLLSDLITKKRRSRFGNGKSDVRLAKFIDLDFSDRFDLRKSYLSDDF